MTGIEYGPDLDEPYAEIGDEVHNLFDLKNYPIKRNSHRERAKIQRRMRRAKGIGSKILCINTHAAGKIEHEESVYGEIVLDPIIEDGLLSIKDNAAIAPIAKEFGSKQLIEALHEAAENTQQLTA